MRFALIIVLLVSGYTAFGQDAENGVYICPPCGCQSDSRQFDEPGNCPSCSMDLVNKENPGEGYDYDNIYPADLCETARNYLYLDVRTKKEFEGRLGHISGAINIPIDELEQRLLELDSYKSKPILVYCLVSIRSVKASQLLVDNGFSDITNMLGGMDMLDDMGKEQMPCKETVQVFE